MLSVLLACAPPGPVHVSGTTRPVAPDDPVDLVSDALAARCPDATPSEGRPGDDLRRVTLDGAGPVCNDGTPPVLYVRRATDPLHARDWVLYVDGGSSCADHEECAVRWCGEEAVYDASKMSSAWAPPTIGADGMRSREDWNAFAGWNHALLHYCSSDFWMGAKGEHVFEGDPPYRVYFEGHDILLAALDALQAGVTSDDAVETLPSLDEAATVLLTGSSAGGMGAGSHLRELAARLPDARVIGVIDAILPPPAALMTADEAEARLASVRANWDGFVAPVWGGVVDEACAAATGEPWRCTDLDVALRAAALPAELAVHQDLLDPVLYPTFEGLGMSRLRLAALWSEGLRLYADAVPGTAVHGSRCAHHTALSHRSWMTGLTVADDAGVPWSLQDLLVAQLEGEPIAAVDDPTGAATTCP